MEIIKLRGIDFTKEELEKSYFEDNKKYIIKYKTIYRLMYGKNVGFHTLEVYKNYNKKDIGYTKRGRYIMSNADLVNSLIGKELFLD